MTAEVAKKSVEVGRKHHPVAEADQSRFARGPKSLPGLMRRRKPATVNHGARPWWSVPAPTGAIFSFVSGRFLIPRRLRRDRDDIGSDASRHLARTDDTDDNWPQYDHENQAQDFLIPLSALGERLTAHDEHGEQAAYAEIKAKEFRSRFHERPRRGLKSE